MNTYRWPPRTSNVMRGLDGDCEALWLHPSPCCAHRPATASFSRASNGSTRRIVSSGSTSGSEDSGSRKPSGESPAIAYRRSRRSGHALTARPRSVRRRDGHAAAARSPPAFRCPPEAALPAARALRACSGRRRSGPPRAATPTRWRSSLGSRLRKSSARAPAARPSAVASAAANAWAVAMSSWPGLDVSASVARCHAIAASRPCARSMPSAQRGSGSPGYHLPWPIVQQRRRGAKRREPAMQQVFRQLALACGDSAACSTRRPPCRRSRRTSVRRPGSGARRLQQVGSTCSPSASIAFHCASV